MYGIFGIHDLKLVSPRPHILVSVKNLAVASERRIVSGGLGPEGL
jgi:hypothetical protein